MARGRRTAPGGHPAPVDILRGQQHPPRLVDRFRRIRDRRIHADHQIELRDDGGAIGQIGKLRAQMQQRLAEMARFALKTSLLRSNLTGLKWSQVDIVRRVTWIHPDQAKAKKAITVPLSDTAIAVLLRQRGKRRAPEFVDSVFVYHGRPVYQTVTEAWRKALKRARISDFRWHDLRHT